MPIAFIDDGYTAKGFIRESRGLYPDLRFEFRPAPSEETIPHFDGYRELSAKEQLARTSSLLARHLVKWDLKDKNGRTPNCRDAASMRKLPHPLFFRLEAIITQVSAGDDDPQEAGDSASEGFADKTSEGNSSAG